jgi:hypothetical protein
VTAYPSATTESGATGELFAWRQLFSVTLIISSPAFSESVKPECEQAASHHLDRPNDRSE